MSTKETAGPHQDTHPNHSIPHAKNPGGVSKGNEADVPLGGTIYASTPITFNEDRPVTKVKVRNTGDRPIQIGSHFHFFEVNRALEFDRAAAFGKRLNISATTAIRFEPGDAKTVGQMRENAAYQKTDEPDRRHLRASNDASFRARPAALPALRWRNLRSTSSPE